MKKVFLTIVFGCFFVVFSVAQTQQGSFLAGGNISLYFATEKDQLGGTTQSEVGITDISFAPMGGIFIADEMVVGASLSIFSFVRDFKDLGTKSTNSGFGIGPFFRYYTTQGLFGHASFNVGTSKNKQESGGTTSESDLNIFGWEVGPGYALFLNENVAIEGLIVYENRQQTVKDSDPESKETFSGVRVRIGFTVFIN